MSNEASNCCIIDAVCGIDTASPQINRYTDSFNHIKFLLKKNLDEYTFMIITDIDGYVQIIATDGETLTKGTDENGNTTLLWNIGSEITASRGAVIYQIAAYKLSDGEPESIWYSKEGRLLVSDSIDSTSHSAAIIGSYPNILTKLILQTSELSEKLGSKVDKIDGKGLSSTDFTQAEKTKLNSIDFYAEENVQSDWNEADDSSDAYIKNKPDIEALKSELEEQVNEAKALSGNLRTDVDKHINNEYSDTQHITSEEKSIIDDIPALTEAVSKNKNESEKRDAELLTTIEEVEKVVSENSGNIKKITNGNTVVASANHALTSESAQKDGEGNVIDKTYATKSELYPESVTVPPLTLTPNTAYNFGSVSNLTLAFPTDAKDGDVIYVGFVCRETTNLVVDTSNTYDFDLVPEVDTGYEIYARYSVAQGVARWIVKYSEYTGVGQ